ncbi:hypothetical protein Btru_064356 [Bulinus truncatus]|nr:hypothetical protein Btru_064356 [Bulinus truncatus]
MADMASILNRAPINSSVIKIEHNEKIIHGDKEVILKYSEDQPNQLSQNSHGVGRSLLTLSFDPEDQQKEIEISRTSPEHLAEWLSRSS